MWALLHNLSAARALLRMRQVRALTRAVTEVYEPETLDMRPPKRRSATVLEEPTTFGPYTVFEELGTGGMATVHRAEQRGAAGFRKPIALKRMLPEIASDEESVASFAQEAKLASQLRHHNIVQVYDLGELEGTYYIAMEYVPGRTLKQIMGSSDALPIPTALELLIQLCDALDHAHNACDDHGRPLGIIHRDVSPSNIIVSNSGVLKLIDFGIAKAAQSATRTGVGIMKGKLGYIAPEYIEGQLDARADLYAVGVIAHELLTGECMRIGPNDFAQRVAERQRDILPPSHRNPVVSRDLDDIVMLALNPDPDRRWQSARAMRVALANVARAQGAYVGGDEVRDLVHRMAEGSRPGIGRRVSVERTVMVRKGRLRPWLLALGVTGASALAATWLLMS
jgi:eukaryotic-like serine/threonine-protein kinase